MWIESSEVTFGTIQELSLLYDDFPVQGAKQRVLGVGLGWVGGGAVVQKRSREGPQSRFFYFQPDLWGDDPILTVAYSWNGWKHQLVLLMF